MRDVARLIDEETQKFRRVCPTFKKLGHCKVPECSCGMKGEIWGYIKGIIPDDYHNTDITHFDGFIRDGSKRVRVVPEDVTADAKRAMMRFCWKNIEDGDEYESSWIERSAMGDRKRSGSNLVIYGSGWLKAVNQYGEETAFRKQSGKTMLAAVAMKEAIKLRLHAMHASDSYEWVGFSPLMTRLMEDIRDGERHKDFIADLQECDWLVVDAITSARAVSDKSKALRAERLDTVFNERLEKRLPTILVFQDDIQKMGDLSEDFGYAISAIVKSNKTLRIALA